FIVRTEKRVLSASVIVRVTAWSITSPGVRSSNHRPMTGRSALMAPPLAPAPRPAAVPGRGAGGPPARSGREPQRAVEADVLAVQVRVAGDRLDQQGELLGLAHPPGEDHAFGGVLLQALAGGEHDRRAHRARRDG